MIASGLRASALRFAVRMITVLTCCQRDWNALKSQRSESLIMAVGETDPVKWFPTLPSF